MPYSIGKIVWYRKTRDDTDITYVGTDPCAATVVEVHGAALADLIIMVDNDTPVLRTGVPMVGHTDAPADGHYATEARG